jgi:hypothetical protein
VRFPDGKPHKILLNTLTGRDVERGRWKRTTDGVVHLDDVAQFICDELKAGTA